MTGRRALLLVPAVLLVAAAAYFAFLHRAYPSDTVPEGAYLRIAKGVNLGKPKEFFAYLETSAQHAAYSIRDYRKKSRELVLKAYPEPQRSRLAGQYASEAAAPDGADIFAIYALRLHWLDRLRRDVSGVAQVDVQGERATVQTMRGTRYSFRRRENGIWGLTMFTSTLVAEAEKAARDYTVIEEAATDYLRNGRGPSGLPPSQPAP